MGVKARRRTRTRAKQVGHVHSISRKADGRYVPWIPGQKLEETNETQNRQRLQRVEKLEQNMKLKEHEKIVATQN